MPRPRLWRADRTFSTRTTPVAAASAIATLGSRQLERSAALVQRQASRLLPVAADQQASWPYTRAAPGRQPPISGAPPAPATADLGVPGLHPAQGVHLGGVLVGELRRPSPQDPYQRLVDVHDG